MRIRPSHSSIPRRRVRPWIALRAFLKAVRDPEDTENGARWVMALEGSRSEANFQRFRRDPMGARILAERRSLTALLMDRDALRAMPDGSLGRAYLDFVERENLSADGLAAAVAPVEEEMGPLDPERRLFRDRVGAMHDLWHVVSGYSRDLIGELALLGFSYVQLRTRAFGLILPWAPLLNERQAPGTRELVRHARERAEGAVWLPAQDWEALLPQPLAAVRDQLGVGPAPPYTRYFRNPRGWGLVAEGEAIS